MPYAVTWLVFAAGFVLVYYVTVRTVPGRSVSDVSLRGALLTDTWLGRVLDPVLNIVSAASLLGAATMIAVIALVRLLRLPGLAAVAVLLGANGSAALLKRVVLTRPDVGLDEIAPATLNSLPSGHTTAAFSAVVALLFVLPRRWRSVTASAGGGFAVLAALATMSAGWHRAGDSMAAFLLVGLWASAAAAVVALLDPASGGRRSAEGRDGRGPRAARWLAVLAAGLLGLGAVTVFVLASLAPLRESVLGPPVAFLSGALLIGGTAVVVLLGVQRLLDRTFARPAPDDV